MQIPDEHKILLSTVKTLPSDYTDYGGEVERWKTDDNYPDCSWGCRWFFPLDGDLGLDWGVCGNSNGPRKGLLTFEHQAGLGCFESDDSEFIDTEEVMQEMMGEWKLDNN